MPPYFSIVIPTRGRPAFLKYAIMSVLRQTFSNFEIIVVDNNTDSETSKIVSEFSDSRIFYYKTGGLGMPDNWEFGLSKSTGDFITILSDRLVYTTKFVLEKIAHATRGNHVVSWKWGMCDDETFEISGIQGTGEIKLFRSEDVIRGFLNGKWQHVAYLFPKYLNSCISRSFYTELKRKWGRVCFEMSPDYTAAFLQLLTTEEIVHVDECLFLSGGNNVSNGNTARVDANIQRKYLKETGTDPDDFYRLTPVKVITTRNSIFNDFFKMVDLVKGPFSWKDVDMKEYFIVVYNEIMLLKQMDEREIRIQKWNEALELQENGINEIVKDRIKNISIKPAESWGAWVKKLFIPGKTVENVTGVSNNKFNNIIEAIEDYEMRTTSSEKKV